MHALCVLQVATMLLTDRADYAECNRAYVDYFASHALAERLPARSSALSGQGLRL